MKKILWTLGLIFVLTLGAPALRAASESLVLSDSAGNTLGEYTIQLEETEEQILQEQSERPQPLRFLFKKKQQKNRRIIAAIMAFPFPFGIVGLHRIYLGTKPYVPVVYIATLGGVFGILPFIDFCVLLINKDASRYVNNGKVFMWVK